MAFYQTLANTVFLLSAASAAPAAAQDKSAYSLFNPTPAAAMREMNTDRPDQTESPYTVDAGHVQVEMDLWTHGVDKDAGERTIENAYAPVNFKVGLTNRADLQIVFEPYRDSLTRNIATGTVTDRVHGVGDVTARLKINFWGNDGGDTAMGIMPFVKLPTSSGGVGNKYAEGGVILPLAISLTEGLDLGVMTEVDAERNSLDTGYTAVFVNSATLGFDLSERIGMYTEIATAHSSERGARWDVSFDTGLTYALSGNFKLDAGVNVGLTSAARDLNPFIGLSWRF